MFCACNSMLIKLITQWGLIVYYLFVAMLKLVLIDCLMSVFITLFNCLLFVFVTDVQTFVCVISICKFEHVINSIL